MTTGMATAGRWAGAAVALGAAALAFFVALHHPLWPAALCAALTLWIGAAWRWPLAWWWVLPAALPLASAAPWTGWMGCDEFDLVVWGAIAAGWGRRVLLPGGTPAWPTLRERLVAVAVAAVLLLGFARGLLDAGGWPALDWFDPPTGALNSWRVSKPLLALLLMCPLLRDDLARHAPAALRRLLAGMLAGLSVVVLATLWERAAYPGLWDFDAAYRTTALFWEMHVGGAAIDAYLAMAAPFVAWALWASRGRKRWLAAAALSLLAAYAALTTFSRGVYLAVALPLVLLLPLFWPRTAARPLWWRIAVPVAWALAAGAALAAVAVHWGLGVAAMLLAGPALLLGWRRWRCGAWRWQLAAGATLALALVLEAVAVLSGSFMAARVGRSATDYESRSAHWQRGLALLQTPQQWLLGIGAGRLPAHYSAASRAGELSGDARWRPAEAGGVLELRGPASRPSLAGLHGLTQRVTLHERYLLRLRYRTDRPVAVLWRVCELHLLYERDCQGVLARVAPDDGRWQAVETVLDGDALSRGPVLAPRQAALMLSVLDPGARLWLDDIELLDAASHRPVLHNGSFDRDLARWLPSAQFYFLPWHIDNLFLEVVIERGVAAAALLAAGIAGLAWRLLRRRAAALRGEPTAFVAAAVLGVLCVGAVSSVLDAPRGAWLAGWLAATAWLLSGPSSRQPAPEQKLAPALLPR